VDGRQQRRALTAAEQAIRHLGAGDGTRAVDAAQRAAELDQIEVFAGLPAAVGRAAADLDGGGAISAAAWEGVSAAVGQGPLAFLVDEVRPGTVRG
jgi:hypothetical protein